MYKCDKCEFECASEKLMAQHKEREEAGLTEREQKQAYIKEHKDKINAYLEDK
jgi:hypothetical protein